MWLADYFANDYWGIDYFSKDGFTAGGGGEGNSRLLLLGVD